MALSVVPFISVSRGRWSCPRTASTYIDEGTAQLAHVTWSSRQKVEFRRADRTVKAASMFVFAVLVDAVAV